MKMKNITLITIIAIILSFSIRTLNTVFPMMFRDIVLAQSVQVIFLLCEIAVLIFFITLFITLGKQKKDKLSNVSILPILGGALVIFASAKGLFQAFSFFSSIHIIKFFWDINTFLIFIPLINSFLLIVFFAVFAGEMKSAEKINLNKAGKIACISTLFSLIPKSVTVHFHFLRGSKFIWDLPMAAVITGFVVIGLSFLGFLYFFLIFYNESEVFEINS